MTWLDKVTRFSLGLSVLAASGCGGGRGDGKLTRQEMTDTLFAAISANREAYTREVVDRLQYQERIMEAKEHFREEKVLPLPAQMLRMSAETINQSKDALFSYALLSQWPINKQNGPRTESEKVGLRAVAETGKSHYTEETLGGKRYFAAYYPDKGIVEACVKCHNDHPDSQRKDFRVGDVLGGIVIRVRIEE
ncbi:DUF3365 domain-containing protein [Polyangium sp. 15x6]|uniref:c-type heme family protein n=1 Tax=Polyangium sp. 15x6 TaxID=3042687 RepID=UPI00249CA26A|nr:DUF3365 domain-containing protein [Polyangium sp. 15x6]MDI3288342.1 DUF3365 domain-containing protein [Polyangium sp. 15x6]